MKAKKIQVLRMARDLIADGERSYLCHALGAVAGRNVRLKETAWRLIEHVMRELEGHGTLENWQKAHRGMPTDYRRSRRDRLAWIDWMIADLENL